jgi:predicted Zn-dependent peptidase
MLALAVGVLVASGFTWSLVSTTEEFTVNGLKVIVQPSSANEIISVQLYIRGGSLNLNEATQGIEPLIFRSAVTGSGQYTKEQVNAILDRTAAVITTSSNRDYTVVNLRCLTKDFDQVWEVFTDAIMHPSLVPEEVELIRQRMLLQIQQREDNPDSYVREIATGMFYQGHPYRFDPNGVEASVANISTDQMRDHLRSILETSNLLLVAIGNIDKGDLVTKVESSFGTLPVGASAPRFPTTIRHRSANLKAVERDLPTNYILGLAAAPSVRDPDFYPMTMAMSILGSRVWEEVRTKRSLSYAPSAYYSPSLASQAAIYVTAVQPDTTIKVMLHEVKRLQEEPVSAKDLDDRTTMYLTRYFLANETNANQGRFLAQFELSGLGWRESERFVDNLRKVTAADVQRVANTYLTDMQFAVLGNPALIDRAAFAVVED